MTSGIILCILSQVVTSCDRWYHLVHLVTGGDILWQVVSSCASCHRWYLVHLVTGGDILWQVVTSCDRWYLVTGGDILWQVVTSCALCHRWWHLVTWITPALYQCDILKRGWSLVTGTVCVVLITDLIISFDKGLPRLLFIEPLVFCKLIMHAPSWQEFGQTLSVIINWPVLL